MKIEIKYNDEFYEFDRDDIIHTDDNPIDIVWLVMELIGYDCEMVEYFVENDIFKINIIKIIKE